MEAERLKIKEMFHLSDYQLKKFDAFFDLFDVNGNGYVDYGSYLIHILCLKDRLNWADNDPNFQEMINLKTVMWNMINIIEDTILQGRINRTQWAHFWGGVADAVANGRAFRFGSDIPNVATPPSGWVISLLHTTFKTVGFSRTGVISREEFGLHLECLGVPVKDKKLSEIWEQVTLDQDDPLLKIDEMEELFSQWILNQDENEPLPGDYFPYGGYGVQWN